MGKWVLTIIWDDGKKEYHKYNERINAEQAQHGYRMEFGDQIQYSSIKWRWNN